jgi:hypothetical protein
VKFGAFEAFSFFCHPHSDAYGIKHKDTKGHQVLYSSTKDYFYPALQMDFYPAQL